MNELLRHTPDLETLDKRSLFHAFTALADHERNGPMIIVKGQGVWLEDNQGRRYIDGMAGLWCVNVGYGRLEIADAIHHQAVTLPYFHAFSSWATDTPILLAEKIIEMAPVPMSKVFFGQSGSDANDTQVKLVWYYNNARGKSEKKKIIARNRGYYGVTVVSGSLTGMPSLHSGFDLPLPFVRHTTAPYRLWEAAPGMSDAAFTAKLAKDLEDLILAEGPDTVGAVIMEPVMGAGGVIAPPEGYYAAIRAVLDKYDALLIADEVISGFGRLGTMFGTTAMAMQPDLITVAKGITSAYVPLSGCIVSEKVWRTIVDGQPKLGAFGHGYTYSAHPLAAAAALANLKIIEDDGLVAQAANRGRAPAREAAGSLCRSSTGGRDPRTRPRRRRRIRGEEGARDALRSDAQDRRAHRQGRAGRRTHHARPATCGHHLLLAAFRDLGRGGRPDGLGRPQGRRRRDGRVGA
jgi:L-2,4-diaminobutyrate transaminase